MVFYRLDGLLIKLKEAIMKTSKTLTLCICLALTAIVATGDMIQLVIFASRLIHGFTPAIIPVICAILILWGCIEYIRLVYNQYHATVSK